MKKLFSILFASLILLSGMHFTVATHLCGGEISQVKLSFTHQKASCGMCGEEEATSTDKTIGNESCCKDQMAFYVVDSQYNASTLELNKPTQQVSQVFYIAANLRLQNISNIFSAYANVHPPDNYFVSDVNLPDICVFRI